MHLLKMSRPLYICIILIIIKSFIVNIVGMYVKIPLRFDAREKWPKCAGIIGTIQDQSRCGSCWAVGSASVISDRICIHSRGTQKFLVSSQDLLTCSCTGCGCSGGKTASAFNYWRDIGVVSGGSYNTSGNCKAYTIPPHYKPAYPSEYEETPECKSTCDDGSMPERVKASNVIVIDSPSLYQMQFEIMTNGPILAVMAVYKDFMAYKRGIYSHQDADENYIMIHSFKVFGWGVENGTKYWLCANSFSSNWGEEGFFRILRGINHCFVEERVVYGNL